MTESSPRNGITLSPEGGRTEVVWFIDFACRHTRRIRDVLLRTVKRFGPKRVTMRVRFLPAHGDASARLAARAAVAADAQGRYIDMHRALFATTDGYTHDSVLALARELELDLERFRTDLDAPETEAQIDADIAFAREHGATHTPGLLIDGRRYHGVWDETALIEAIERPMGVRIALASSDFFHWAASAGMVLVIATLLALVVANVGFHDAYEHFRETPFALTFGTHSFSMPFEVWINDALMALFFLLVGIEIKREIVSGELSSPQSAALPIVGALGGMIVPALIFAGINLGEETIKGWGVPMATDIAFTLGLMALLGDRVPTSLKVFVSALAIADDLGAILVIALFYGNGFDPMALAVAGLVLGVMIGLNLGRFYARLPYLLLGVVLWYFVYESGLHATLAGVLTAAVIPSRPAANIEGAAAQARALFEEEMLDPDTPVADENLNSLQTVVNRLRDPGFHLQKALENWSNFLILPLFAFFNTGIIVFGSSFSVTAPETLGVMVGLVIGKPLGILLAVFLAVRLGIAHLSSEITWVQLLGAGCLCGVGFTMSIFIGSAAFEGAQLESVKLAILLASTIAAMLGVGVLWLGGRNRNALPA